MSANTTDARTAALTALAAGWALTLRQLDSGSYSAPADPSGYRHATVKMVGGCYHVETENGATLNLTGPCAGQTATTVDGRTVHNALSYGRRQRVSVAWAMLDWAHGGTLDWDRFTLHGEGTCTRPGCNRRLTRSVARGFTTGDACGGRLLAPLSERRGWGLSLEALVSRAGKSPAPLAPAPVAAPLPPCGGPLVCTDWDCPDC